MSKSPWIVKTELLNVGKSLKKEFVVKDDATDEVIVRLGDEDKAKLIGCSPELFETLHEALDLLQKPSTLDPDERKQRDVAIGLFVTRAYSILFKVED